MKTVRKDLQFLKASFLITLIESGSVTSRNDSQPQKAYSSMLFTELGIITDSKDEHHLNAHLPIVVTELGIVAFVIEWSNTSFKTVPDWSNSKTLSIVMSMYNLRLFNLRAYRNSNKKGICHQFCIL